MIWAMMTVSTVQQWIREARLNSFFLQLRIRSIFRSVEPVDVDGRCAETLLSRTGQRQGEGTCALKVGQEQEGYPSGIQAREGVDVD